MIDPKLLRTDLQGVARNLARRSVVLDVAKLTALEEERKRVQVQSDRVRSDRNANAKAVGMAKGRGEDTTPLIARGEQLTHELARIDESLNAVQAELERWQLALPNLLHGTVPDGRDESSNVEV
ncbi:MAG: serine--tRNA ligase, partial [Steroidobacteraceae bacterium]